MLSRRFWRARACVYDGGEDRNAMIMHVQAVAPNLCFKGMTMGFIGDPLTNIYVSNTYTGIGVGIKFILLNVT